MKKTIVLCSVLVVGSAVTMRAQQVPVAVREGQRAGGTAPADQVGERRLTSLIEGRVVKGAPYSAEIVTETVQVLQDGNRIVQRTTGRIYRDSEGRVRREEDRPSGGPSVSIMDPVAGKSFTLNPANRTARETPALALLELTHSLNRVAVRNTLLSPGYSWVTSDVLTGRPGIRYTRVGGDVANEEKLPDRTIEGVVASGIRRTTTIAAGAIGNERPISIVSEEWTSTDLQVLVLTDLNDPRAGRSTYKLLKISRAEPDPALFRVPGDYAVERLPRR